jgi:hypothetical protein
MKVANILRTIIFATAAAYLIFIQDHSAMTGIYAIQYVSTGLAFGSLVLFKIDKSTDKLQTIIVPGAIAFLVALLSIFLDVSSAEIRLTVLTSLVALYAGATAVAESFLSTRNAGTDKMELRISAGINAITALVFGFAQLDALNAVGFLSAYLSIVAVQRAIWLASPKTKE